MKLFRSIATFSLAVIMITASSCQEDKYPDLGDGLFAEIVTNKGTMVAKLTPEKTPVTVANFVALAEGTHPMVAEKFKGKRFYDGLIFHRVMNDFMIQGGDPEGTGSGSPGYKFNDELDPTLKHDKAGVLAMANPGANANGSQFYIIEKPTPWLDGYDQDGTLKNCQDPRTYCHTVFGEVLLGMDIHDSISNVKVDQRNKPLEQITIEQINIVRQGFDARSFDAAAVWTEELPKLEESQKKQVEEAQRIAEEKRAATEKMKADAAAAFLPTLNDYKSKTEKRPSGLMVYYITKGDGPKPKPGQSVLAHYEGYFTDGILFDSSKKEVETAYGMFNPEKEKRGFYRPMQVQISPDAAMIAGFKEALAEMSIGDKAFFYIPSHLAYGEAGRGAIAPNTDLTFVIEMLEIVQ